jgi:hypothetical protein
MSGVIDGDLFTGRITDDVMNLCVGAPGPETLKKSAELFDSAARHRLQKFGGCELALFQYGPECGSAEFLQQLAQFLTKEYSNQVPFKIFKRIFQCSFLCNFPNSCAENSVQIGVLYSSVSPALENINEIHQL